MKYTNRLANESSPYLLQHAHNPVEWYPWGAEALEKAKQEDKPIILSIGYAACHWCHVMERESFENEQLAQLMNQYFVCIKVDREERPDIDQVYMEAVQAMGVQGGWPLNVFLTSKQQPFFGGTYFPPNQWESVLRQIAQVYRERRDELDESALMVTRALQQSEYERFGMETEWEFSFPDFSKAFEKLAQKFDPNFGGMKRAPKFPMPTLYSFMLRYYDFVGNEQAFHHAIKTLREMAFGGIYDQIGGGFARYSVDAEWFAPHFEKMLYDNAQLISLYTDAYTLTSDLAFLEVIEESLAFVVRELMSPEGGCYSALDADSEGVEGKYYTWEYQELQSLIAEDDLPIFRQYYGINPEGNWEHGRNILYRSVDEETFAVEQGISYDELDEKIAHWKTVLMTTRAERIRPQLDDKILTSWNGLMIQAFADAYMATGRVAYLASAQQIARFIDEHMTEPNGQLWHTYKAGKASVMGFLEDYAAVIQGYYKLYQAGFEKDWLFRATELTSYALEAFHDEKDPLLFFTDAKAAQLIARKKEVFDNVIPASNSIMAHNLYLLGVALGNSEWIAKSKTMLQTVSSLLYKDMEYVSNWASLATMVAGKTAEVVIVGRKSPFMALEMRQTYIPNKVIIASEKEDDSLELLKGRKAIAGKTTVYVCYNRTCQLPVHTPEDAVAIIQQANTQR